MNPETSQAEKNEKPPYLYHETRTAGIGMFEPRIDPERNESAKIYALPELSVARMSILNGPGVVGGSIDGFLYVCVPQSRDGFLQSDKGGICL